MRKHQKLFDFTLIFVFLFCEIFSISGYAATTSTIAFSKNQLTVGDEFTVTVRINADEEMQSVQYNINYDATLLQYVGGDDCNGGAGTVIVAFGGGGQKTATKKCTFKAIGVGSARITTSDAVYVNKDLSKVAVPAQGGTVAIKANIEILQPDWKYNPTTKLLVINSNIKNSESYIELPWYEHINEITTIYVNDTVTEIGDYLFSKMPSLKMVSLSENISKIGEGAFSNCPNLEEINIPDSVLEITPKAFYNCGNLKNIDISNVVSVGDFSFYRCSSLENISLDNTEYIGNFAFNKCNGLNEVVFSQKLANIGENAFADCNILLKAFLPQSVIFVDKTAFEGCENLLTSTLGDVNCDGIAGAIDLIYLRKSILGFQKSEKIVSDINNDNIVNIFDLICLKKIIAK